MIFGFQSNELVEEFECSLDGEQFSGCDAVLELTGLTPGQHTLEVRAIDIVENVDPTPASYTWTVVGEPETTITSGPPAVSGSAERHVHLRVRPARRHVPVLGRRLRARPLHLAVHRRPADPGRAHASRSTRMNQFSYLDGERVLDQTPAEFEWEVQDVDPARHGDPLGRPPRP